MRGPGAMATDRARQLRRERTPAESILWRHLRGRRFAGFKFRHQHPIGPFYADFAYHECKLIVEVDGETHLGREQHDTERTKYLETAGWCVIRFWNTQVYDELEPVLEAIYRACVARTPPQPLSPEAGERGELSKGAAPGSCHVAEPPHPQPLSPEAGERGERNRKPCPPAC